uniref:Uncharacterized protein n=1 Tax=Helianthus annuus TaxID=4232 RepID=A0A251T8U4_HELAN
MSISLNGFLFRFCCLCPEVSCSLISRGFLPALCLITTIRVTEYKIQFGGWLYKDSSWFYYF